MKIILSHQFSPLRQRGKPEASICCVIKAGPRLSSAEVRHSSL